MSAQQKQLLCIFQNWEWNFLPGLLTFATVIAYYFTVDTEGKGHRHRLPAHRDPRLSPHPALLCGWAQLGLQNPTPSPSCSRKLEAGREDETDQNTARPIQRNTLVPPVSAGVSALLTPLAPFWAWNPKRCTYVSSEGGGRWGLGSLLIKTRKPPPCGPIIWWCLPVDSLFSCSPFSFGKSFLVLADKCQLCS